MKDIRVTQLAENLINNAIALKAGENILIETTDTPDEISTELVKAVVKAGGNAFVRNSNSRVRREWIKSATKQALELRAKLDLDEMKQMQAYIAIRGADNAMENCDIDDEKMFLFRTLNEDVLNYRVNETRWCVLRWPNPSMAQGAKMSTEAFEDFYFKACLADYPKMNKAASHLVDLMNRTDKVRLVAADTDLTFSIKGIPRCRAAAT